MKPFRRMAILPATNRLDRVRDDPKLPLFRPNQVSATMDELRKILETASISGQPVASELLPLVYDELRTLASKRMNEEAPGQTLQATALVHEVWLRLTTNDNRDWVNRTHFFRAASQAMRRILVERARAKSAWKRGAGQETLDITGIEVADASPDERILLVEESLQKLELEDPECAKLITLKFFGGLTNKEIAIMNGVGERSVERQWAYARGRLYQMICDEYSK